jgi:hypothetical protein
MIIPVLALRLAGFVLGHALWSISDLPEDEALVPLAMSEQAGKRKLVRFEAGTQEQAIWVGKEAMKKLTGCVDAWAFARDGLFREGTGKTDVILVDLWARGMKSPITIVQRYDPLAKRGRFKVIGEPFILINGKVVDSSKYVESLSELHKGLLEHEKVAELWEGWQ